MILAKANCALNYSPPTESLGYCNKLGLFYDRVRKFEIRPFHLSLQNPFCSFGLR